MVPVRVQGELNGELMKVKHSNWFAAGPEVRRALVLLSDGAFRLYFYLCLQASRDTGCLTISYGALAGGLARSRRSIVTYLEELRRHGICQVHPAVNQHQENEIELCDEFWPYTKSENVMKSPDAESYFIKIKSLLDDRACVRCAFTEPDKKFAAALLARDISIRQIERAIALGCSRKYVSCLNGTDGGSIVSFSYFRDLIEDAGELDSPAGYWDYLNLQLKTLETRWVARDAGADIA